MDEVAVLVRMPATYQGREAVVQVPESAFSTGCWKTIAALAAAVDMGIPFTAVLRAAKYGMRKEDKKRLFGESAPHPSPAATPALKDASCVSIAAALAIKPTTVPRTVVSPQGEGIERR